MLEEGKATPVDVSKLQDPLFQPRKRGVFNLKTQDLQLLVAHMDILLQYLSFDVDTNKRKVLEFVEYATNDETHINFLRDQLQKYQELNYEEKNQNFTIHFDPDVGPQKTSTRLLLPKNIS